MTNFSNDIQVDKALAKWQRILRLQDWQIDVKICRHYDMDGPEYNGLINTTLCNKQASIRLLSYEDYPPLRDDTNIRRSMEQALVHELLHCHFDPFWTDEKKVVMEQAIDSIACALVAVHGT